MFQHVLSIILKDGNLFLSIIHLCYEMMFSPQHNMVYITDYVFPAYD